MVIWGWGFVFVITIETEASKKTNDFLPSWPNSSKRWVVLERGHQPPGTTVLPAECFP